VVCFQPINCSSPFKLCHIYLRHMFMFGLHPARSLFLSVPYTDTSVKVYSIGGPYFCIYHWYVLIFFSTKCLSYLQNQIIYFRIFVCKLTTKK
jgi:hypothetical protein